MFTVTTFKNTKPVKRIYVGNSEVEGFNIAHEFALTANPDESVRGIWDNEYNPAFLLTNNRINTPRSMQKNPIG